MRTFKSLLAIVAMLLCSFTASASSFPDWTSYDTSSMTYTINAKAGYVLAFDWFVEWGENNDCLIVTLDDTEVFNADAIARSGMFTYTFYNEGIYTLEVKYPQNDVGDSYATVSNIKLFTGATTYPDWNWSPAYYPDTPSKVSTTIEAKVGETLAFDWQVQDGDLIVALDDKVLLYEGGIGHGAYSYTFEKSGTFTLTGEYQSFENASSWSHTGVYNVKLFSAPLNNVNSGSCGDNLTWVFSTNGILTIEGTGDMNNYGYSDTDKAPWEVYKSSIKAIVINEGVTSIGDYAFYGYDLTSFTIPNSVTRIGESAFEACSDLMSINIPNNVTSIGGEAFWSCEGLTSIRIPNSVTSIGEEAFSGCSNLTSITVESGNRKYDSRENCNAIIETQTNTLITGCQSTIIPTNVTSIGDHAFRYCDHLTSINIPSSITSIGDFAFHSCSRLTSITIPQGVSSIGQYTFAYCDALTSIIIPNGVTKIDSDAFWSCENLASVTIPNSVTSIGSSAFADCKSLTSIVIPNGVTYIGYSAFEDCSSLTSVTSLIPVDKLFSIDRYAFYNVDTKNCVLTVPYGAKSTYEATYGWNVFSQIVEMTDITLVDGVDFSNAEDLDADNIIYTRTLPNLHWNALYVPFKIPYANLADDYEVAYINAVHSYDNDDNGTIDDLSMEVMKIKAGTLKANYPYLIKARDEEAKSMTISVADAVLYAAEENSVNCASVYQTFEITGSYSRKSAEDLAESLAISTEGAWQPLATGTYLNPFRLYLTITNRDDSPVEVEPAALSRVRIIENGETTGILDLTPAVKKETYIFDLSGRRVLTPQKGQLYIVNGKKVVY